MSRTQHHFQTGAKLLRAELRLPGASGPAIIAEDADQTGGVFAERVVRRKSIGTRQVAPLLERWDEAGGVGRAMRRWRHVKHHRQRILKRHITRFRARMRFAD
jgi:hypothetical protein